MTNGNGYHAPHWHGYQDGGTLGLQGAEGGTIFRDEEHASGARLTLERDCVHVPFALSCDIYGWAIHTRFFADEPTARHAFDEMQPAIAEILALIPKPDDPDPSGRADSAAGAIDAFIQRFP